MACALALAGCGEAGPVVGTMGDRDAGARDVAGMAMEAAAPCAPGGAGRLRVAVSLDPTLDARRAEVWLAALCGERGQTVRVVRWDRSATQSLDELGPGRYQVYASSFVAPGTYSPQVELAGVTTAAVPITLTGGTGMLTRFDSVHAQDAGVAPVPDAGMAGVAWRGRAGIVSPADGSTLGWVEVAVTPFGQDEVAVYALVRNTCATVPCGALVLRGVEARMLEREMPVGVGAVLLEARRLGVGESAAMPRPIVLRGALPDREHTLAVAVYGEIEAPGR